jgi:predicted DNA-binding transcriptional regulator AlpA
MPSDKSKPPSTLEPLLDYKDLEKLLGVRRRTIERWVASGRFPRPMKVGGTDRWRQSTVLAHLDRLEAEAR